MENAFAPMASWSRGSTMPIMMSYPPGAGSRLRAVSTEPDEGLEPTDGEIMA